MKSRDTPAPPTAFRASSGSSNAFCCGSALNKRKFSAPQNQRPSFDLGLGIFFSHQFGEPIYQLRHHHDLDLVTVAVTTAAMGRLHSKGKGISASAIPYSRAAPAWLKTTPEQVVEQICKLARKGATPSQIGVILRDSHGVAQVKIVTGTSSSLSFLEGARSWPGCSTDADARQPNPAYSQIEWCDALKMRKRHRICTLFSRRFFSYASVRSRLTERLNRPRSRHS